MTRYVAPSLRTTRDYATEKLPFAPPDVARTNSAPPGWGKDELSKFLQETHQQQYATFHNKRAAVARLVAIDDLFVRVSKAWVNPPSEIAAMLFRGATRRSGQPPERPWPDRSLKATGSVAE